MSDLYEKLTFAEFEALAYVAQGFTYEEGAELLSISKAAFADRIQGCMRVLGARNAAHAVARAVEAGYQILSRPRHARYPIPDRRSGRVRVRGVP